MTNKLHVHPGHSVTLSYGTGYSLRWDDAGHCSEQVGTKASRHRRADLDFGTPIGDLLIDPWVQDMLRKAHK